MSASRAVPPSVVTRKPLPSRSTPATSSPATSSTPFLAVVVVHREREVAREEPRADRLLGEDHRHHGAVLRQRSRDLRPDEAPTDDDHAAAFADAGTESAVVGQRPVVDDPVRRAGDLARPAARGEQQSLVAVRIASVVGGGAGVEVERDDGTAEVQLDALLLRPAPDRALVLAQPEALGERGTRVRRVGLVPDEADRAVRVDRANPLARGVTGHPAADDEIPIVGHADAPLL